MNRRLAPSLIHRIGWAGLSLALGGCSTTTTALPPANGARSYSIECMQLGECLAAAQRACGGGYETVSTAHNRIPESELPGLNKATDAHRYVGGGTRTPNPSDVSWSGPGIESDAPMPLAEVVVVCKGAS